jgi:hypothetical protein
MRIRSVIGATVVFGMMTAATFAGDKYSDGKLTVEWTPSGDDYSGTITLGTQQFPATAHNAGGGFTGSFTAGANQFPFTGTLDGDTLALTTGGTKYMLKKEAAPGNPLASPNPLAGGANSGPSGAMANYSVVTTTDTGKALATEKAGASTVQAALEATLPDLASYFGAKPTIGSAYQDAKDPKSGGATFSSTLNDQPIKGIISCKLNDKGASVAVVYAAANTSKADWDKLTGPPQAAAPAQASAPAAPPQPTFALKEFDFPDGTGSLELADGWTTQCQTCINPVFIAGPAQQSIVLNNMLHIETPDSPMQRMKQQNQRMMDQLAANARAQGRSFTPMPAPPGPPPLVSPYLEPVEALKAIVPQMSKVSEYNKGPTTTLDNIVSTKDAPSPVPNGKAAIILYEYTQTKDGQSTQFRRSIFLITAPQGQGGWLWMVTGVAAPAATFKQDAPLMFAMMNSLKVNQQQFTQNLNAQTQNNIHNTQVLGQAETQAIVTRAQMGRDDLNTQYQVHQDQQQASADAFARHNQQWAADETAKQQSNADFIETIKGTRLVVDTQTGASGYANLSDVNGVVDSLNQAALDPNRFVQVPLRDYLYAPTPVPGQH